MVMIQTLVPIHTTLGRSDLGPDSSPEKEESKSIKDINEVTAQAPIPYLYLTFRTNCGRIVRS